MFRIMRAKPAPGTIGYGDRMLGADWLEMLVADWLEMLVADWLEMLVADWLPLQLVADWLTPGGNPRMLSWPHLGLRTRWRVVDLDVTASVQPAHCIDGPHSKSI